MSNSERLAVVSGASRGIGKAIALQLANAGHPVACVATVRDNALGTVAEIEAMGGRAEAFGCDVSNYDATEALFRDIESRMGDCSVLVNNAGITRDALLMRMKVEDWQRVLDVNLNGVFNTVKVATKPMMKARWGRIINISSVIGLHGGAGQVNYSASKAGVVGLTMSLARELGSRGITVNAIAPGFIESDMTADLSEEMRSRVISQSPAGRLGCANDIAPAVAFLASDGASFITGQTLTIDGGLYL